MRIGLTWLDHGRGLALPRRESRGAAGYDLAAALSADAVLEIASGQRVLVPCGFALALPEGFEAQIRSRSGLAAKYGISVLNSPGTVDADYRGEIKVILINHGEAPFAIRRGDRIAQMVIASVPETELAVTDSLEGTERGENGFGSTGMGT